VLLSDEAARTLLHSSIDKLHHTQLAHDTQYCKHPKEHKVGN